MTDPAFTIAQNHNVLLPRGGEAYPIPCAEWAHLKTQIGEIKTSFDLYHTIGSALLGVGFSGFFSIFTGAIPNDPNKLKPYIVAWVASIGCTVVGFIGLHFARESAKLMTKAAKAVVDQMDLIELRFRDAASASTGAASNPAQIPAPTLQQRPSTTASPQQSEPDA